MNIQGAQQESLLQYDEGTVIQERESRYINTCYVGGTHHRDGYIHKDKPTTSLKVNKSEDSGSAHYTTLSDLEGELMLYTHGRINHN